MKTCLMISLLFFSSFAYSHIVKYNILFIHSYDSQHGWTKSIERNFNEIFKNRPSVKIFNEYLDAKRFPNHENKIEFYQYLSNKYSEITFKAVVISDDPAMNLFLKKTNVFFKEIPVFFMGINKVSNRLIEEKNITGSFENQRLDNVVKDIKSSLNVNEIILLSDTSSTGISNKEKILDFKDDDFMPEIITIIEDANISNLKSKITKYSKNIPIFIIGKLRDPDNGELLIVKDYYPGIFDQVDNPFFVLGNLKYNKKVLGGYSLNIKKHVQDTAYLLIQYLDGTPMEDIEAITEVDNTWYWNSNELDKYSISKNNLPKGSVVLFENKETYEFDKKEVLTYFFFMLLSLLSTLLLLIIVRNARLNEKVLREKVSLTEKLEYEASHDYLTGLFNRRTFNTVLKELEINKFTSKSGKNIYVAILDLANFKTVNDTAGHMIGDCLLAEVAELMSQHVHATDTFTRLSGDKFGLVLANHTQNEVCMICSDIIDSVSQYRLTWNDMTFSIGVSVGVVKAHEDDLKEVLISHADMACYKAKEQGKNLAYFTDSNDSDIQDELAMLGHISDIAGALDNDQFFLAKQLIHPLNPGESSLHYEILLRYKDKNGNAVSPAVFIPAAEKHGLITLIDKWVVFNVLSKYKVLFPNETPTVSINLSGVSVSSSSFLEEVLDIVNSVDMDMSKVCFEITETAVVSHINRAVNFIKELKKTGCQFALDDFGSGSSSYSYLKTLPVDYLKIDGSLIKSIISEPIDQTIVRSINEIAHEMDMKTIAEFVENDQIMNLLDSMGVDYGQGFGIHKPETCIE
ncbi:MULTISPECIES: EAL domain-containing protein [unclassified Marinomonas]|uniref:EAL domain-containing protein n=1 Tax=unclassified Marinomonas TaxID=196814 RepID=UPI0007AF82C2|nr:MULTISPECIES: EAL domain-containing protein [unclassified Marinomonas]